MAHSLTARCGLRWRGLFVGCTALVFIASPAFADQDSTASSSTQSASAAAPSDFLLGRPRGSVGIRGSMLFASANSDIYDFVTDVLALDKSDFNTGSFGAEFGVNVSPRVDIIGAIDLNGMSEASDYREWEDNRGNPIEQTTELKQMNFTASVKFALLPRGRAVSRLAWIPNTFIPYIGAGAGYGKYEFRQNGDFVDFDNGNNVFPDTFRSEGWAPTYHVMGGTDIRVYKHLLLSLDGRYSWQHAELDEDFIGFEPIDLGGFRFGAGIHFAF